MTQKTSPTTGSLTINRHFKQTPQKVFAAFSDPAMKQQWFTGPKGGEALERRMEVTSGGEEVLKFRRPSGMITHFIASYHAVEPDKRIVYSYNLLINGNHHSTSLAVVELMATDKGTDMIFTEHVAWQDGTELAAGLGSREKGTRWQFDNVERVLEG